MKEQFLPFKRVVLTGGPCAGKTTSLALIVKYFTERGYSVFVVPEAAGLLVGMGHQPPDRNDPLAAYRFQELILETMLRLEALSARRAAAAGPALVLCDRGILDGKAFCPGPVWSDLMTSRGLSEGEIRDRRYDAVFHLVTAADGAKRAYTRANNPARTDSADEAIEVDRRLRSAWAGHPRHQIIDNRRGFGGKIAALIRGIEAFLN